jgi:hypothetical protein
MSAASLATGSAAPAHRDSRGAVERLRQVRAVEVAVVQDPAGGHVYQGFSAAAFISTDSTRSTCPERFHRRAVRLRQRPQPLRILDAGARTLRVRAEQLAQPPRGGALTGMRPRRVHPFGVGLGGAGHG